MNAEPLSHLAQTLEESEILRYGNAVKALQAQGRQVFNLTVGDFDPTIFQIPIRLKREIMKAYAEDYTSYPMAGGNTDLRSAISTFELTWNGLTYSRDEILVGSGGRPLIYALFRTLCDSGDGVIYGVPSWNCRYYAQLTGARVVEIFTRAEAGFLPTLDQLRPYLSSATLLCLCSPQNPSGTVFTREALSAICAAVVRENNRRKPEAKKIFILYDALYSSLTAKGFTHLNPVQLCPECRPWVLTVNAVSKIFAGTGLRVGWCLGPTALIAAMKTLLNHMGAWAPMAEQKALARFLPETGEIAGFYKNFKAELFDRLETISAAIKQLHLNGYPVDVIPPQGSVFLSIQLSILGCRTDKGTLRTAAAIATHLLQEAGIAVLPFSAFGAPDDLPWFRLSVGACRRQDVPTIIKRLQAVITPFKKSRTPLASG